MALPRKLMIDGEKVVETMRTHVKVLIVPFLVLVVVCGVGGYVAAVADRSVGRPAMWIVIALAAVLLVWGTIIPFVKWLTWTYTVTNKRLVEQKGILTRTGRVIPLSRVNDVAFEKNLNDRILGCGTLVIHDASEQSGLRFRDVPRIEAVHRTITQLVFEAHGGRDESV